MIEEQNITPQDTTETTPQVSQGEEVKRSRAEDNLVAMRKRLESEEEARKAAERRAYEIEQRYNQNNSQVAPQITQGQSEEDDIQVDNEDYVQAKHIKTTNKKFKTKLSATDEKIAELERKLSYFEAKIDTDSLKDFDKVVSDDNLRTFARLYPDDYQSMMSNPNLKSKSKTAYNMIKNYGIYSELDHASTEAKLNSNHQKPKSSSIASPQSPQTPLSRLNDYDRRVLSESDRDRILAEVERKKLSWG